MSGKGDARRPAQVSRATIEANWERAFGHGDKSPRALPATPPDSQPTAAALYEQAFG